MIFPKQKIDTSKKNKKWRKDCTDFIINNSTNENYYDIDRMIDAYKIINSDLTKEEMRKICTNLGVDKNVAQKYVQVYNHIHKIYASLKGEELDRPFNYNVANIAPNATNEALIEEELEYKKYIKAVYEKNMKIFNREIQNELKIKAGELDPSKADKQIEQLKKQLQKEYSEILDPLKISARYQKKIRAKEEMILKLIKMASTRKRVKWTRNETFGDAIATAKEFVEIIPSSKGDLPDIRQLNPLNVFYHKSPDTPFIHESDQAGYEEYMTYGQIMDHCYDKLSNEDIKKIEEFQGTFKNTYGTGDSMHHKRGDRNASSWKSVAEAGLYPSGPDLDPYSRIIEDGVMKGVPSSGGPSGSSVRGSGLYGDENSFKDGYYTVYTVYWKSYRKAVKYTYTNEYGEMAEEIVDDSFVIPDDARKETYRDNEYFGRVNTKHVWYDNKEQYNSAEYIFIPEIWKGRRINHDIYFDIEPLENAYQSLLNPYAAKLPIYGYIHNSRNASVVSIINRVTPWQKLHWVIMSKLLRMLAQDKGILTFLNSLMIDKTIGVKRTLQMAEDQGLVFYNPLAHSKGGTFVNTLKVAERVDASNSQMIKYYVELLEFVENKINESVGMSPQRMAQSSPNTTATDNQMQTVHSVNMTEPLFYAHDMLWEDVMQGYMEMCVSSLNETSGKIRGFLSDSEIAVLDLGMISLEDEYLLKVKNNQKDFRILQKGYTFMMSLVQNDKASLSTLIDMMQEEDLNSFKTELKKIEEDIQLRKEASEKRQIEHQEKLKQMEIDAREDDQINTLDKEYLSGVMDHEKEHIKGRYLATSFNLGNDSDKDGVPDLIDQQIKYEELLARVAQRDREIDLREAEILQNQDKIEKDFEIKQKESESNT